MLAPRRNRARVLTADGLKKLQTQVRSHEQENNWGQRYTLERLGELIGRDPETVKNVLDGKGCDKRSIVDCFTAFGLTLTDGDHVSAAQATAAKPDSNFVGREGAIADLDRLVNENNRVIVIQARGGVGKTTLARKYLTQAFGSFLEFPIAKETKDIASIEGLLEEKLRQLGEEPGREFLVSLDRLKRKLQTEAIGILIDNLEPALDSGGKLIAAHRSYVELLRVLADPTVKSLTLITTRERLREPAVTVCHYALKTLDLAAWEAFFGSRSLPTETPALAALHHAYGGNAKAMDIVSGAVREDFAGDVGAYWQANQADLLVERDLEDLVTQQFDRLQQLDSDAYHLLCRMGCYRYQDVPTVPIEGLFCLLWDVPENRQRRVIKSLQDRSLVDCENGEFWLHPVVREEAVEHLRSSEDWKRANHEAVSFWINHIEIIASIEDGLKNFEAYYHLLAINNFHLAANVILKLKITHAGVRAERLGSVLGWRFGLNQKVVYAIEFLLPELELESQLSSLHLILGYAYHLLGFPHKAIEHHKKSADSANLGLSYPERYQESEDRSNLMVRELYSFENISLALIDLWDLENALVYLSRLEKGLEKISFTNLRSFEDVQDLSLDVKFIKALVKVIIGSREEANRLAIQAYEELKKGSKNSWSQAYGLLFVGKTFRELDELELSSEAYSKAISFSDRTEYRVVKAKSLAGVAEICRDRKLFNEALYNHQASIKLLIDLDARIDLAEAYFQLGLTYQAISEAEKSDESFQEAIRLFTEMEAPKQVERVRKSIQNG